MNGLPQDQLQHMQGVLEQRKLALLEQIENEAAEADARASLLNEIEASPANSASVHRTPSSAKRPSTTWRRRPSSSRRWPGLPMAVTACATTAAKPSACRA